MEIVTYIKWTAPNERKVFEELAKSSRDNTELESSLIRELNISSLDARRVILKFKDKIKQLRNQ